MVESQLRNETALESFTDYVEQAQELFNLDGATLEKYLEEVLQLVKLRRKTKQSGPLTLIEWEITPEETKAKPLPVDWGTFLSRKQLDLMFQGRETEPFYAALTKLWDNPERVKYANTTVHVTSDGKIVDHVDDTTFGFMLGPKGEPQVPHFMNRCARHDSSWARSSSDEGSIKARIDGLRLKYNKKEVEVKQAFKDSGAVCVFLDDETFAALGLPHSDVKLLMNGGRQVAVWAIVASFLNKEFEVCVAKSRELWPDTKPANIVGTQVLSRFFGTDDPLNNVSTFYRYSPPSRKRKDADDDVHKTYGCDPKVTFVARSLPRPFQSWPALDDANDVVKKAKGGDGKKDEDEEQTTLV